MKLSKYNDLKAQKNLLSSIQRNIRIYYAEAVLAIVDLPDLLDDHDEEAALVVLLLLLEGNSSSLFCHLPTILVPSGVGSWLAAHLSGQLQPLAKPDAGVVETLDELRQDTVGIFVHLHRVRIQRRLTLANCVDCNNSELIVCVCSQVQSSVGQVSDIVIIEPEPGSSGIATFDDVAGNP